MFVVVISFYISLFCMLLGYLTFTALKHKCSFGLYTGLLFGFVFGASTIGFVVGYFGPIIWSPSAAQGPLLGIFITGPLGAIVGLVTFWVYMFKYRKDT